MFTTHEVDLPQLQEIRITNHTPDSTENNGMHWTVYSSIGMLLSEVKSTRFFQSKGSTDGLVAFMSVRKVTLSSSVFSPDVINRFTELPF